MVKDLVPVERVLKGILLLRGHRVMLDADLAELYGVPTKALNQAVKRNLNRFPADFMFKLTRNESGSRGGFPPLAPTPPYVPVGIRRFTKNAQVCDARQEG